MWVWKRRLWLWRFESDRVEAEDINIDEYLSSDDTPDYKTQTNNYSDDDEERESPLAPVKFSSGSHQSVEYVYPEWRRTRYCWIFSRSIDDMGYIRRSVQIL
jgi:RNA polymerase sigma-54 factor